jgi:hypothetical protein
MKQTDMTLKFKALVKNLSPWFDRKKYFVTTFTFGMSLFFLVDHFMKDNIESEFDLYTVSGNLANYSFENKDRYSFRTGKNTTHEYYLWLDNCTNTFQISANYLNFFREPDFKDKVKIHDKVTLRIPNSQVKYLNTSDKRIQTMSLESSGEIFLDKDDTVLVYNNGFDLGASAVFFGVGFVWLLVKLYNEAP